MRDRRVEKQLASFSGSHVTFDGYVKPTGASAMQASSPFSSLSDLQVVKFDHES